MRRNAECFRTRAPCESVCESASLGQRGETTRDTPGQRTGGGSVWHRQPGRRSPSSERRVHPVRRPARPPARRADARVAVPRAIAASAARSPACVAQRPRSEATAPLHLEGSACGCPRRSSSSPGVPARTTRDVARGRARGLPTKTDIDMWSSFGSRSAASHVSISACCARWSLHGTAPRLRHSSPVQASSSGILSRTKASRSAALVRSGKPLALVLSSRKKRPSSAPLWRPPR